jgi:transmembrane sensor
MDSFSEYDNTPWDLITSSFQEILSGEESRQLEEWLSLHPGNREKYEQLRKVWEEGLSDYRLYHQADAQADWRALQDRMAPGITRPSGISRPRKGKVLSIVFQKKATRWAGAAILILLAILIGDRYFSGRSTTITYETAMGELKKISLPDGSFVTLKGGAKLRMDRAFGKTSRTLALEKGEAFFEVSHQPSYPFTVNMESSSVQDIGTRFTIQNIKGSVWVSVLSGRVAFISKVTKEERQLSEGMALSFNARESSFGEVTFTGLINDSSRNLLKFDNVSLSEVVTILQRMTGKKIILNDTALEEKRLTARLDGESFDNAIKIICTSLDLDYMEDKDICILKKKMGK